MSNGTTPAMALELASRALEVAPEVKDHMSVSLQGCRLPRSGSNALTLNFRAGRTTFPPTHFRGFAFLPGERKRRVLPPPLQRKIALFGSALDFQDRKLTSKRFATAPEKLGTERCVVTPAKTEPIVSSSIDGVSFHATAINNLLRRDAVEEWRPLLRGLRRLRRRQYRRHKRPPFRSRLGRTNHIVRNCGMDRGRPLLHSTAQLQCRSCSRLPALSSRCLRQLLIGSLLSTRSGASCVALLHSLSHQR